MDDNGAERLKRAAQEALQAGEAEYALTLLTPLLEARTDDAEALVVAGVALLGIGKSSHSLAALDRALSLSPDSPAVHFNRGRALERLGRLEDAARAYGRTLDLEPENSPAANRLSRLLRGTTVDSPAPPPPQPGGADRPEKANSRRRIVRRSGASSETDVAVSDEVTLRAAAAMSQVVQRLEQLVERVDGVSSRGSSASPTSLLSTGEPVLRESAVVPTAPIARTPPDAEVWFQRSAIPERPDPATIPSSYGPEMWPAGFQDEALLPNVWQLCGAIFQLFLVKPLPWLIPLIATHAVAAICGMMVSLNGWVELLLWEMAFVAGVSPALVVLTDQWILGGEPSAAPYVKRLIGIGRLVLLTQALIFAPLTILLAWRTSLPIALLNSLAIALTFPFHVLLAPALFLCATEETSLGEALRAGIAMVSGRARVHLGAMSLTLLGGGSLVAGLVALLSRSFAGAGHSFDTLWWLLGASLGGGLWGASLIACGADAMAANGVEDGEASS